MGKIALVTGGTRGIGEAIARALLQEGYRVVANYASRDESAHAFRDATGIAVYKWDITDFESCQHGLAKVQRDLDGPIEVLVNNAGITRDAALHKMDAKHWHEVIDTNLTSCFNMSRLVIDSMRERKYGRIINISSINGQLGQFGQTNYSAAKAGMIGFIKALARETASRGITVNAVSPGYIATEMLKTVREDILEKIVAQIPVGRLGEPRDIARAVLFLASEQASFITGETLSVNGGQYME